MRACQLIMKKTGTIEALNVSPKGFYEGFLLRTGKKIIQINLPKEEHGTSGEGLNPGDRVTVEVEPESPRGEPVHEVFRLVGLPGANDHLAKGDKHGTRHFSGRIERLNYALHGEVNGGMMDSGDFLHLKPEGARSVKLTTGMKVNGRGSSRPMLGGHSVMEATEVNGIEIHHHKPKKKHAASHARE